MTIKRIEDYWSDFFGISVEQLNSRKIIVVPHKGLAGYNGAWIFKHKLCWIISVPKDLQEKIAFMITEGTMHGSNLFEEEALRDLFGKNITKIIGPTFQGYYDQEIITGELSDQVIVLNRQEHKKEIAELSNSGDPRGWLHSGTSKNQDYLFGFEHEGKILSIANYKMVDKDVGFIGVYTHPDYRGRGLGQEVVKRAINDLISRKKLVLYQTLMSNMSSVVLAKSIGVQEYATNIAVRF